MEIMSKQIIIKCISKNQASHFYKKYEHLGNCGLGVWHFGLFIDSELISVVSYGTANFNTRYGVLANVSRKHNVRIIQLARGGTRFDAPANMPSMLIKTSLKKMREKLGNTIVIAYSDTRWNEMGTIYQASNFMYLGMTEPGGQANYIINGRIISGWVIRKKYGTRSLDKLKKLGISAKKISLTSKHRYVFVNSSPLKKKFISRDISPYRYLYPKRSSLNVGSMIEIHKNLSLVAMYND